MQRFSHKASLVLEKKIFKGFYHLWTWRPSWSMDGNHFSILSFPCPRESPNEIWAMLAQRLQNRSHSKLSTFFPIQIHSKANLTLLEKNQMSMYNHYFSNFGRPSVTNDICKDSAKRHPRFWRRSFLKVFTTYGQRRPSWSIDGNHFSNRSFPCPREAPNEIWATLAQRLQRRSCLKFWTFFPYKCTGKQTWPRHRKRVKCQCTTIILATFIDWLCLGLSTCQPLWVILCGLPEKGRKEIEEIVEEMKERNMEERGSGIKVKKQKK